MDVFSRRSSSPNDRISVQLKEIRLKWANVGPFSPEKCVPIFDFTPQKRVLVPRVWKIFAGVRLRTGSRQA